MNKTNTEMAIVKGIAIILMVAGHAEAHSIVTNFIYLFHMPVFFIAAGYFFSDSNLDNPWIFCKKRFKGLYVTFLKWALFFLLIHNVQFHFGILNETYGNWEGGVTHPYTFHSFCQRLFNIVFSMSGYDEFMAGAFWFFRALLLVSLGYLFLRILIRKILPRYSGAVAASLIICASALAFAAFRIGEGLKIATVPQGGIRETWGMFFFSFGVIFRHIQPRIRIRGWHALLIFGILLVGANFHWAGMNLSPKMQDIATLPSTGILGFIMLMWVAGKIDSSESVAKSFLSYCGAMTVYVYVFHIAAFKVVSLIKIWVFDLDFKQIGCHMVIHDFAPGDFFWVAYTVVGVGLPLLWITLWRKYMPALGGYLTDKGRLILSSSK